MLFVTIEMRHAPFFGWITDLSAPDPTSVFNLFGLMPFSVDFLPPFLQLGAWPIMMGLSMWLQMRLNPTRGPGTGTDLPVHADHLHLPSGHIPGRSGDLQDL